MTEHQLEEIHNYTKFKVVELLIDKHNVSYERWASWGEYTILAGFGDRR